MANATTKSAAQAGKVRRPLDWALWFCRLTLSAAFLSAVADRFGLWGAVETMGVDWGSMARFAEDVRVLNPWAPEFLITSLAWFVTILEAILGVMLLTGPFVRIAAVASGVLLLLFAVAMAFFLGAKLPLNYSVFTAAACSFLVAALHRQRVCYAA